MSTFSENMRRIRFEKHMTQEEFADLLGTTKQNISRYESGAVSPKITTAKAIADKLGISLAELSGEMDALRAEFLASSEGRMDRLRSIGKQLTGQASGISEIEFALSGEIHDLTEDEMRDVLDYVRFKRAQKVMQEARHDD